MPIHQNKWKCPKCGHDEYEMDRLRASRSLLATLFDVANRKFSTVTCKKCRYTELYQTDPESLEQSFESFRM